MSGLVLHHPTMVGKLEEEGRRCPWMSLEQSELVAQVVVLYWSAGASKVASTWLPGGDLCELCY